MLLGVEGVAGGGVWIGLSPGLLAAPELNCPIPLIGPFAFDTDGARFGRAGARTGGHTTRAAGSPAPHEPERHAPAGRQDPAYAS